MRKLKIAPMFSLILFSASAFAQEKPVAPGLSSDPERAWAEIRQEARAIEPDFGADPSDGEVRDYEQKVFAIAGRLADRAATFAQRFPKHKSAGEARLLAAKALVLASVCDGGEAAEKKLAELLGKYLADKSIPEDEKLEYFAWREQLPTIKKLGVKMLLTTDDEMEAAARRSRADALLAARKVFPGNVALYSELLAFTDDPEDELGAKIAAEIANSPDAPEAVRKAAKTIAEGTHPYEIGKPLEIKFVAFDGREVNLARLRGKVVLIDFWATWCSPCVEELPRVKAVYDKLHPKGFEIIGISLDNEKEAFEFFLKKRDVPWPQYFDGKGWKNDYALKYAINKIPQMWLVDRKGNLSDIHAGEDLEKKIEKLLLAK